MVERNQNAQDAFIEKMRTIQRPPIFFHFIQTLQSMWATEYIDLETAMVFSMDLTITVDPALRREFLNSVYIPEAVKAYLLDEEKCGLDWLDPEPDVMWDQNWIDTYPDDYPANMPITPPSDDDREEIQIGVGDALAQDVVNSGEGFEALDTGGAKFKLVRVVGPQVNERHEIDCIFGEIASDGSASSLNALSDLERSNKQANGKQAPTVKDRDLQEEESEDYRTSNIEIKGMHIGC